MAASSTPVTRPSLSVQIAGGIAFEHADGGRAPHRLEQGRHDGAPGGVALDVQDAPRAVRGLAPQRPMALQILVEGNAIAEQILDAPARLSRHQQRDLLIDDAGAGPDRVGGVGLGRVALRERRGDAGLRPQAGGAFAKVCARDHGDGQRRELQRREQPGQAGADNHHAAVSRHRRGSADLPLEAASKPAGLNG